MTPDASGTDTFPRPGTVLRNSFQRTRSDPAADDPAALSGVRRRHEQIAVEDVTLKECPTLLSAAIEIFAARTDERTSDFEDLDGVFGPETQLVTAWFALSFNSGDCPALTG